MAFTLGLDFGTNSVRASIVRTADGAAAGGLADYASGEAGILLEAADHALARQNPADYLRGLTASVRAALRAGRKWRGFSPAAIAGIGVTATGSSPLPLDGRNRPLALNPRWRRHPAAQCWLWKDHTAWREAAEITARAAQLRPRYLERCGGTYTSEWFWSKLWHCRRSAPEVFAAAADWAELSDWIPAVLAGVTDPRLIVRNAGAAGLKAMYGAGWGGWPDERFLAGLDPALAAYRRGLPAAVGEPGARAGLLSAAWAKRLGLPAGIPVAVGQIDCYSGAVGCGVKEGRLVKIIGTSACDCAVVPPGRNPRGIAGICGIAPGAILPGMQGLEAGQSAVGDIFKWWVERVGGGGAADHRRLCRQAKAQLPGASGLLALDWHNGNRNVLADPLLSGLLLGCTLQTTSAEIYRALIEATAFGSRAIADRLNEQGVAIREVVCAGGIAEKNPLLMQIYADVLGRTLRVAASAQACALGAAIGAAVAAGVHPDFPAAQRAMTRLKRRHYRPNRRHRRVYDLLYRQYRLLHDGFGGARRREDYSRVMKALLEIKTHSHP